MMQIAALRSRLEKQPTDLRRSPRDLGDGALGFNVIDYGCCPYQATGKDTVIINEAG
jgi:hypothetical protein